MVLLRWLIALSLFISIAQANTFGTVFNVTGGASDLVLDESRQNLYLVRPSPYDRVDVYSIPQRRITASVSVGALPLAAALSWDKRFLYVTCHNASALNVLNLTSSPPTVAGRISLPAKPEGVAVGKDGRVLMTTIGSGAGNLLNTLLIYDPSVTDVGSSLLTVPVAPPPPQPPQLPPLAGRVYLANRSQLMATPDGSKIIGLNAFNQNTRVVFVYEVATGIVLKSRYVGDISTVLSVSPSADKFMVGLRLFETATLTVLAQQNAANALFPMSINITATGFAQVGQQFNIQQNNGGSVFAPDGSYIFSAFNIAPVQNPAARANIAHLMINDPDNLFIHGAIQMPENLAGKMVIASDGSTIFALSESGFVVIPLSDLGRSLMVEPVQTALVLANDQCGAAPGGRSARITIRAQGAAANFQATPTLIQALSITGLAGAGTPGGGQPGQTPIIVFPPAPGAGLPGQLPTNLAGVNQQTAQLILSAPTARSMRTQEGIQFEFGFSGQAARSLGTIAPHDFLVTTAQAVNVPPSIRVYQNNRDTEARGEVFVVPTAVNPAEGLEDIIADSVRRKLYISNSGLNRVEVFDIGSKTFQTPIKVGQLPGSMALAPDGNTLYVANYGGESISIVDLNKMASVGRIKFPPIPFNGNVPVITPTNLAATQRGLLIVMSNGTLWKTVGDEALPRDLSTIIGSRTVTAPRTLTATPNGEFALLLAGNGYTYLYDSMVDDFVQARQVMTAPIFGYYGPLSAGPRGQYYVVNDVVLNQSLSPILGGSAAPVVVGTGRLPTTTAVTPVSAVAAVGGNTYARFKLPTRANANAVLTTPPEIEVIDINTGQVRQTATALEGPLSTITGNQRANVAGRTMALDANGTTAYVLTTSGLSIVPLEPAARTAAPAVNRNGVVHLATYQTAIPQNGLVSIFGANLASSETAATTPLPTILGGVCVTMGSTPIPLLMTSPTQINAQIPPELNTGRYSLMIRSIDRKASSTAQTITVSRYAPGVLADTEGRALVFHADGSLVTAARPARRDQQYTMYAVGMGLPVKTRLVGGAPAPASPPAETVDASVYFGDPRYAQSEVIVEWSGLAPGFVGLYQLNLRVPGFHMRGDKLPVSINVGGVSSPLTGPVVPTIAVD